MEAKAEIGTDAGVRVHAVEAAIEAKVTRAIGVDSLAEAEPGAKAQTEVADPEVRVEVPTRSHATRLAQATAYQLVRKE